MRTQKPRSKWLTPGNIEKFRRDVDLVMARKAGQAPKVNHRPLPFDDWKNVVVPLETDSAGGN